VTVASDDPADFAAAVMRAASDGAPGLEAARPRVRAELRWELLAARVHDALRGAVQGR
jgi:hypothetical protein